MEIEIINWDKYNPRHDVKHPTWFRLNNNFWADSAIYPLDSDGKMVWIGLLAFASQASCGRYDLNMDLLCVLLGISNSKLMDVLKKLQDSGKIRIPTLRGRYARGTRTLRERYATDRRDERDETDGTVTLGLPEEAAAPAEEAHYLEPEEPPTAPGPKKPKAPPSPKTGAGQVWDAYREAYARRYGTDPVRNAKVNGQCSQLVARLGIERALVVASFYLTHNGRFYVQTTHALGPCLKDAEALWTQCQTGQRVTHTQAHEADKGQANQDVFERLAKKWEAEDEAKKLGEAQ